MTEQKSDKQKREEEAVAKLNAFLKENSIALNPALTFPNYNKLPVELELAIAVIQKHEPAFDLQVIPEEVSKK